MSTETLNSVAHDLMAVKQMISDLEKEADTLVEKIKEVMVELGKETISGDTWTATWKNIKSSRFDSKAFKAAHPTEYAEFCKPVTSTRFTIGV